MHILHRILVHLPGDVPASERESRREYLERIRFYAEVETEEFYETAYDWRAAGPASMAPNGPALKRANIPKMFSLVLRMGECSFGS